jgi:flagellar biosynthesis chaperone FliJ
MKLMLVKLIVGIFFLFGLSLSATAQEVISQSEPTKKEIKLATSLEKAKDELEKSRIKLAALRINYDKKRNKFEKQNAKGKLSPNAVASHAKILNNLSKKIANEQSKIEKLEKFISQKI